MTKNDIVQKLRGYKTLQGMINFIDSHFKLHESLGHVKQVIISKQFADVVWRLKLDPKTEAELKADEKEKNAEGEALTIAENKIKELGSSLKTSNGKLQVADSQLKLTKETLTSTTKLHDSLQDKLKVAEAEIKQLKK